MPEGLREWMLSLPGSLVLRPDHAKAYKNGQVFDLRKAPRVEDGATLIPLRHVGEFMGHKVHWDGESIIIR